MYADDIWSVSAPQLINLEADVKHLEKLQH